jgi:hypothetical protein
MQNKGGGAWGVIGPAVRITDQIREARGLGKTVAEIGGVEVLLRQQHHFPHGAIRVYLPSSQTREPSPT